ncbi:TIGR02186 family protein [Alkalilacustris brevis]|uniref:TIGR02186 family protein n=1 Tax=Alkalilacustris brevis TaxID=2026338 RepID=UPI000E0D8BE6|nr:TIGR02186 family protein [Alkalilacustris brevis]
MRIPGFLIAFIMLLGLPARGEEVVAALSQTNVALTATFEGSEILVYGAVRREAPIPEGDPPLEVIVTVQGPAGPLTVWRKARRAGIWVNVEAVSVSSAPSYYAVATSGLLGDVLTATEDLRHRVSIPRAIRAFGAADTVPDAEAFTDALLRIREEDGLYQLLEGEVELDRDTLFTARISLPANITEGVYSTRIFLTRGGAVIDRFDTAIDVSKVGIERWLFVTAHEQPVFYGLLAVLIAMFSGWAASAGFRYLRS